MHEPLRCWDFSRINPKLFISTWFSPCGSRYNTVLSHSVTSNSATPWTVAHQAPLSLGFPRQEYWSELPFPSGDLPHPGIKPGSPTLQADSLPSEPAGKPYWSSNLCIRSTVKTIVVMIIIITIFTVY